jgi:hypothetical protein
MGRRTVKSLRRRSGAHGPHSHRRAWQCCPPQGHQQATSLPHNSRHVAATISGLNMFTEGINGIGADLGVGFTDTIRVASDSRAAGRSAGQPAEAQGSPLSDYMGAFAVLNASWKCHGRPSNIVVNGHSGGRTPALDWHGGQLENETLRSGKATPVSVHELLSSQNLADGAEPAD